MSRKRKMRSKEMIGLMIHVDSLINMAHNGGPRGHEHFFNPRRTVKDDEGDTVKTYRLCRCGERFLAETRMKKITS